MNEPKLTDDDDGDTIEEEEEPKITDDDDGDTIEEEEEPKITDDDDGDTQTTEDSIVGEGRNPDADLEDDDKLCSKSIGSEKYAEQSGWDQSLDSFQNDYDDAVEKDLNSKYDLPQDTVELTKEEIESKNRVNEEIMKLIMYRSQRKWYATISIISIFGGLLIMMLSFIAMQKDLLPEWKEVLLLLLGAFVGSFSRVIDHWFNNSQAEEKLLESANT